MALSRSPRVRKEVDYRQLAGVDIESEEEPLLEKKSVSQTASLKPEDEELEPCGDLVSQLAELAEQLKEEEMINKQLKENEQVRLLKGKLDKLREENMRLKTNRKPSAVKGKKSSFLKKNGGKEKNSDMPTLNDLRKTVSLSNQVEEYFQELEFEDSESDGDYWNPKDKANDSSNSTSDSSDEDRRKKLTKKGKSRGKKSGRSATPGSSVKFPQLWPHGQLNTAFADKKCYEDLTVEEFVAGYATILQTFRLSSKEYKARLEHLISLMYFASTFDWGAILNFHAAVLLDIESGRSSWGDSFTHLEARTLYASLKGFKSLSGSTSKTVFFCQDYQKGNCKKSKDHFGVVKGESKFVKHICASCWLQGRVQKSHPESSRSCPHFSSRRAEAAQPLDS